MFGELEALGVGRCRRSPRSGARSRCTEAARSGWSSIRWTARSTRSAAALGLRIDRRGLRSLDGRRGRGLRGRARRPSETGGPCAARGRSAAGAGWTGSSRGRSRSWGWRRPARSGSRRGRGDLRPAEPSACASWAPWPPASAWWPPAASTRWSRWARSARSTSRPPSCWCPRRAVRWRCRAGTLWTCDALTLVRRPRPGAHGAPAKVLCLDPRRAAFAHRPDGGAGRLLKRGAAAGPIGTVRRRSTPPTSGAPRRGTIRRRGPGGLRARSGGRRPPWRDSGEWTARGPASAAGGAARASSISTRTGHRVAEPA